MTEENMTGPQLPGCDQAGTSRTVSPTEQRNPRTQELDRLTTLELLKVINSEDRSVAEAVHGVLPRVAELADVAAERLRRGGTIHYFGAGTSGRLGVLDASELMPTYHLEPGRVIGHIAGGEAALVSAVENAEDSVEDGFLVASTLGPDDVAIGIAASGSTPYVRGALKAARQVGAHTALIANNPHAPLAALADTPVLIDTGPEVITGSTRMKAGTAQKLVLNSFSTAVMVAIGRTWENLMVSMVATNAKLRERTVGILCTAGDLDQQAAEDLLAASGGDLRTALVVALGGVEVDSAVELLAQNAYSVREALSASRAVGGSRS